MNKKIIFIILIVLISPIFFSAETLAYDEQETLVDEDGYNITARTVYGFERNDVYVIIEDNTGSKKDVNVTFEYNDGDKTRLLTHLDAMMKANVTKDVYGLTNKTLGKYTTREEYEVSNNNTTETTTYVNYTDDSGELLCRAEIVNSSEKLMTCDYILDDKSVLVEEQGVIDTKEVADWIDLNATQDSEKIETSNKIEFKNGYLPLGKVKESNKVELRLKVKHPPFTSGFEVPDEQNKYNITVESADGVYKTTLDPTWWNDSYPYKRDILNATDNNLILPIQESDIDSDTTNETYYGQNGSIYYNDSSSWAFANDTSQRCGFETTTMTVECPVLTNGLFSYWTLDGTGTVAEDLISNNDGTLNGGVTQGAVGQVNGAYDFDGADDYVEMPYLSFLNKNNDFSITGWVKLSSLSTSQEGIVSVSNINDNQVIVLDYVDGTGFGFRGFDFNAGSPFIDTVDTDFSTNYNAGEWVNFALSYDSVNGPTFYINTNEITTTGNVGTGTDVSSYVVFGHSVQDVYEYSDMVLDDVRIYDRALSSTEISALYDATSPSIQAELGPEQTQNTAPNKPTLNYPPNGSTIADSSPILNVTVTDPDGDATNNSFYGSDPWNLSTTTYNGNNISTQDQLSVDLFFKPDGTKLYEMGDGNNNIYEYDCTDPWNLSTCSYNGNSISTQDGIPSGIFFKPDGTKLYEIGGIGESIYEYDCTDPWNLSTCSYNGNSISTQDVAPSDLFFKDDGTRLYEAGENTDRLYEYDCTDPWNLSTCSYNGNNISTQLTDVQGIFFKDDGTRLYEIDATDVIYEHELKEPWDLTSIVYNLNSINTDNLPLDLFIKGDGNRIYITYDNVSGIDYISEYRLNKLLTTNNNVPSGSSTTYTWNNLDIGTYEWYVESTDGTETTTSDTWTFTKVDKQPYTTIDERQFSEIITSNIYVNVTSFNVDPTDHSEANTSHFLSTVFEVENNATGTTEADIRLLANGVDVGNISKSIVSGVSKTGFITSKPININTTAENISVQLQARRTSTGQNNLKISNVTTTLFGARDSEYGNEIYYRNSDITGTVSTTSYTQIDTTTLTGLNYNGTFVMQYGLNLDKTVMGNLDSYFEITNGANQYNCTQLRTYMANGEQETLGSDCLIKNINSNENITITLYAKDTSGSTTIDGRLNTFLLDNNANTSSLSGQTINTTLSKISETKIEVEEDNDNIIGFIDFSANSTTDNIDIQSQVRVYNSTNDLINKSLFLKRTLGTAGEIEHMILKEGHTGNTVGTYTVELWSKTSSGTATIQNGDISAYTSDNLVEEIINIEDTINPDVIFYNQTPIDLTTINLFDNDNRLDIEYNITDNRGIDFDSVKLYHKTNSSTTDINYFINGSAVTGFIERGFDSVSGDIYEWNVPEWKIYPITHNIDKDILTSTSHNSYTITNNEKGYIKTRIFNVTTVPDNKYNYLEVMANSSSGLGSLGVWYCNVNYEGTNVQPINSPYCTKFYDLAYNEPYDYTENKSQYHIIPFTYNVTTNQLNGVDVTETSYFLLQGAKNTVWKIWTIPTVTRTDQVQTSTDGKAYTNYAGTTDLNLRLFDGYRYRYYACANDTSNNQNCTDLRTETFEIEPLPPLAVDFYSPLKGNYSGNVNINYTESLDPDGTITNYNISLVYVNETLYQHIHDNNLNTSYDWNSSTVPDGNYKIQVTITDNDSLTTDSYSEIITVDNTPPKIEYIDPTPVNGSVIDVDFVTINTSISDTYIDTCAIEFGGINYTGNINSNYCSRTITSLSSDTYTFKAYINDSAGNINSTNLRTIRLRRPGGGAGGIVEPDIVGYFDSKSFTVSPNQEYIKEIKFTSNLGPSNSQTLVVEKVEGEGCQYIKLQKFLGSNEYVDKGTYDFLKEENFINVQINAPSKEIFNGDVLECELKARSNAGTINNFNINIKLKPQIWIRVDNYISDLINEDFKLFSKEICFDQRILSGEDFTCPEDKSIEFGWIFVGLLVLIVILKLLL